MIWNKGFIIERETEAEYYARPKHLQGTCIMENCIRIGEFWRKGWTETMMLLSLIKAENGGENIRHANIFNKKTRKIIDVANAKIKMVDYDEWKTHNKVIAYSIITYDDVLSIKTADGEEYDGINDEEMFGLRDKCNNVFRGFINNY